jgi:hypothetical protein
MMTKPLMGSVSLLLHNIRTTIVQEAFFGTTIVQGLGFRVSNYTF